MALTDDHCFVCPVEQPLTAVHCLICLNDMSSHSTVDKKPSFSRIWTEITGDGKTIGRPLLGNRIRAAKKILYNEQPHLLRLESKSRVIKSASEKQLRGKTPDVRFIFQLATRLCSLLKVILCNPISAIN